MSKRENDRRSKKKRDWRDWTAATEKGRASNTLEPTVKTGFYCARNRNSKIRRLRNSLVVWLASQVTPEVKYLPANAGDIRDVGSIPGSGRSPGIGNGNPLQYSCLDNSTDRGAHEVTKSMTEYQPSFLVVSTPHFHCWGPGFYPWFRNQNLTSLAAKKNKQTNKTHN